jgi:hypothetical protein
MLAYPVKMEEGMRFLAGFALPAALLVTLLIGLAACSGQPTVVNPNKTPAASRADYDDCLGQSAMAAALATKSQDPVSVREKALDTCMKSKGYDVK